MSAPDDDHEWRRTATPETLALQLRQGVLALFDRWFPDDRTEWDATREAIARDQAMTGVLFEEFLEAEEKRTGKGTPLIVYARVVLLYSRDVVDMWRGEPPWPTVAWTFAFDAAHILGAIMALADRGPHDLLEVKRILAAKAQAEGERNAQHAQKRWSENTADIDRAIAYHLAHPGVDKGAAAQAMINEGVVKTTKDPALVRTWLKPSRMNKRKR